ncbi:MAG TPA: hypothetical protein VEV63_13585, partial [Streptosporangiaceae bacterium]|nr:hypothetical protein [Streptosporangiaceae bacterium]
AADVLVGAARDALTGLDAILSYRPADAGPRKNTNGASGEQAASSQAPSGQAASEQKEEPDHEPDHRG